MGKKKWANEVEQRPAPIRWEFDADIPTEDFLERADLADPWNLQEAVDKFIRWLERDRFLTWEAVVCYEQRRSLTVRQEKALDALISFDESDDDQIRYIDEQARPAEAWHVILNSIVPFLLIEPFKTSKVPHDVHLEGWVQIVAALQEHGQGLSLPEGVNSPPEVVPIELRHKLWLQYCFDILSGLGQQDGLNLEKQAWRIDEFIDRLRECKAVVESLSLTLESLLSSVILPERDRPIFMALMQEKLGLDSVQDRIADHL